MSAKPTWQLVLQAAEQLTRAGGSPFMLDTLVKHVQRRDPSRDRGSITPTVQGMTVNAPGGPKSACGEVLRRVDRGLYELAAQPTDPVAEERSADQPWHVDDPVDQLSYVYERRGSVGEIADIIAGRDEVLARYGQLFHPDSLASLTADQFKSFLLYENNRHWWGIHRHQASITSDMEALQGALRILLDEFQPITDRLDHIVRGEGASIVRGLGKAVLTPILMIVYPDRYGVWNSIAESALKRLKLWPEFAAGTSFGARYVEVNTVLNDTATQLSIDLWTLDALLWGVERLSLAATGEDLSDAPPALEVPVVTPSETASFTLKRHLHDFLRDNWDLTELGADWALHEEGGDLVGYEYPTSVGRIDLLARHRSASRWLVVELKRGQSSDQTVGQVTRYMGWVKEHLCGPDDHVQGLVIAHSADDRIRYALEIVPNVGIKAYEVEFRLREV